VGTVTSVMVVDDTDHMRKMLRSMLEIDGFDVAGEAATGEEALATIGTVDPDVVVLDYMMPGIDGLETARRIRAARPEQVIILYTAFLDPKVEAAAKEAGVDLCLAKVEGLDSLEREISRLAGSLF
jgi:two-component system, chemotaxis family, chemotaxis protein CheY